MIELVALYLLAVLDAAFSGICAASGRNARIEKRRYYVRSMLHGVLILQAVVGPAMVMITLVAMTSADVDATVAEMRAVAERLIGFYGIFAAVILGTFLIRAVPSVDLRALTSTVGFGPLTMMRPAVIVLGALYGVWPGVSWPVAATTVVIACLMLPFRQLLNNIFDRLPSYIHPVGS